VTVACPSPATAVGVSGVPGTAIGLVALDAGDELDVPLALVAVAAKV